MNTKIVLLMVLLLGGWFLVELPAHAQSLDQLSYPRTANIFLAPGITREQARTLARWDIVVLDASVQDASPWVFPILREENPDIVLLAYIGSNEFRYSLYDEMESENGPLHAIFNGIDEDWWLQTTDGEFLTSWPGNRTLNVTDFSPTKSGKRWNTYLPEMMQKEVMSTGLWDGIFYDNVWNSVTPFFPDEELDLDLDGTVENSNTQNSAWIDGMAKIFSETRKRIGEDKLIVINGGGGEYMEIVHGRLMENFPSLFGEGWTGSMRYYADAENRSRKPILNIVNGDTSGEMRAENYQRMRYGLMSTLLYDGFFSFDAGPVDHTQLWWYDEFDVDLGYPVSSPRNLLRANDSTIQPGVWMRDFQHGSVLVNSTNREQVVQLPQRMRRIVGNQDPSVNNGKTLDRVVLPSEDGVMLLRTSELIAAPQDYAGDVISLDANAGSHLNAFQPYGPLFHNGIFLAVDDLNRDGNNEIVTIPARGSSHVRIFNDRGRAIAPGFFAFGAGFENGGELATVDFEGDGRKEIVVAAGSGLPPIVRIFDQNGVFVRQFLAYDAGYRNGVSVAAEDFNGDGIEEIVTGSKGSSAHVRVFGADGRVLNAGFFAYPQFNGGIRVSVADLNKDDKYEILTAPATRSDHVQIFSQLGRRLTPGFFPYSGAVQGVNMIAADLNGDQKLEILTGTNLNVTLVRQFDFEGRPLTPGFYVYDPSFLGGIMIQILR